MRNIINISLPGELADSARREVSSGKYASLSEFFRYLLRNHKLAKELQKAKGDFDRGKKNWKLLKSLEDLL